MACKDKEKAVSGWERRENRKWSEHAKRIGQENIVQKICKKKSDIYIYE